MAKQIDTAAQAATDLDDDLKDYDYRLDRPIRVKLPEFQRHERLKHVLFADQFDVDLLEYLGGVADQIRVLAKSKDGHAFLSSLLPHKRAMLYFTQPSTRTFLSFAAACQILGMPCNEVRDPKLSSEAKNESRLDSVRMFSSYFDIIIMRSQIARFAECCAYLMTDLEEFNQRHVPIVNGGAGTDEHPTQALLDIYTIQRTFQFQHPKDSTRWTMYDELRVKYPELRRGLDNKVYGFCGDIGRGRTVKSLASLLSLYENVTFCFVAPEHPTLALKSELRQKLQERNVRIVEAQSFDDTIDGRPIIEAVDCLYMTRIQQEHDSQQDAEAFRKLDLSSYRLNMDLVRRMKDYAPILHPFPRDKFFGEIPPEIDKNPRAMYFRQARNGMWIRAALIAYLFETDSRIANHYAKRYSSPAAFHEVTQ